MGCENPLCSSAERNQALDSKKNEIFAIDTCNMAIFSECLFKYMISFIFL
jgi:hypothetical protein